MKRAKAAEERKAAKQLVGAAANGLSCSVHANGSPMKTAGVTKTRRRAAKQKPEAHAKAKDPDEEAGQDGDMEIEF